MTKRVLYNRFRELLAAKERREGRNISQQEVAQEIGAAINTINIISRNKMNAYIHRATVEKLLDYFGVDHHEFFITVVEEDEESDDAVRVA